LRWNINFYAVADLEDEPIGGVCPMTASFRWNHLEDQQWHFYSKWCLGRLLLAPETQAWWVLIC